MHILKAMSLPPMFADSLSISLRCKVALTGINSVLSVFSLSAVHPKKNVINAQLDA